MEGRRTSMKILVVLTFCILMKIAGSDADKWKDSRDKEFRNVAKELWEEYKIADSDADKWKASRDEAFRDVANELWGELT